MRSPGRCAARIPFGAALRAFRYPAPPVRPLLDLLPHRRRHHRHRAHSPRRPELRTNPVSGDVARSAMSISTAPSPAINVVLVGAGKMGGALLEGWIGLGVDPAAMTVIEPQPSPQVAALVARGLRLNPSGSAGRADAIVIAVKPQTAPEALAEIGALVAPGAVVVSIMAGRTLAFLADALP